MADLASVSSESEESEDMDEGAGQAGITLVQHSTRGRSK